MYALFKETSHANFISHKSNYGANPVANPKNWVAFDGQHVHYSTNNLDLLTQELVWYFRKTAGDDNESIFNDRATITAIKGNSVAWNQLRRNGYNSSVYSPYNSSAPLTFGSNYVQVAFADGNNTAQRVYVDVRNLISTHKFLITYEIIGLTSSTLGTGFYDGNDWKGGATYNNTKWFRIATITTGSNQLGIGYKRSGSISINIGDPICKIRHVNMIDLTLIYGAGNEPSTVTQFDADYFKWFGHPLTYESYDPGSIRNTKIDALKTVGLNQWDEMWEQGIINASSGIAGASSTTIRATNYIKVIPNTEYYFKCNGPVFVLFFYDHNKNYISITSQDATNEIVTIPFNATYLRFRMSSGYGLKYNNNLCISLSNSSLNGTYQPYEDRTYSIPITSITGKLNGSGNSVVVFPDGMKSAGSVADEIVVEGGVTKAIKRIGYINLYNYRNNFAKRNASYNCYQLMNNQIRYKYYENTNMICNKYNYIGTVAAGDNVYSINNKSFIVYYSSSSGTSDCCWYFKDDSCTTLDQFRASLDGVYVTYELPNEEVYILDNFSLPNIKIYKDGTERYESNDFTSTAPKLTIHYNAQ